MEGYADKELSGAQADEGLLHLVKVFLPHKRYLRDLGIDSLPLARLNARLAPLGYVIEAKKVRNAARFVACTDAHGQVEQFGLFELRPVKKDTHESAERLEHAGCAERSNVTPDLPPQAHTPAMAEPKAALLKRLQMMQAEGLSLQAVANRLNAEDVPTFSGQGHWQKGPIGNLLAQGKEAAR